MKKLMVIMLALLIAVPAFALLDDNSVNNAGGNAAATSTATGGNGGNALGGVGFGGTGGSSYVRDSGNSANDIRNTNTNLNNADADSKSISESESESSARSNQKQAQGQAQGQIGSVETSVGGDTEKINTYVMTAPDTVAGAGQQASSIYSIFGGINVAQTAEYVVCREKMDVIENLKKGGYLTVEEAAAEMSATWKQFKDNTQEKRVLWIGPKTRGVHLGNLAGLLAMDSCNEINTDNWLGIKPLLTKKAK